jgi:hypothetical protein
VDQRTKEKTPKKIMKTLLLTISILVAACAVQAQTVGTRVVGNAAATNSFIASSTKGTKVFAITGYSASTQYIQVFQTNGIPANGTVPTFSVPVSAGQFYSIDFSYYGADFDYCTVCNSSTANSLTIGAADTSFQSILRR